jgi:hypothetical protein
LSGIISNLKRFSVRSGILALTGGFLCLASGFQAPRRVNPSISVDQILDRYEAAIGGREAWGKLRNRVVKGTAVYSPSGAKGNIEMYSEVSDKYFAVIDTPVGGKAEVGSNGQVSWSKDPARGLRRLVGRELALSKLEGAFNVEIRLREFFPKMEWVTVKRTESGTVHVVRATSTEGAAFTWYFDGQSGLLVRMIWVDASGSQVDLHIDEYCDLKDVGIRYRCYERMLYPKLTLTLRFTEIRHNVAIDETLFAVPSFAYKIQH